MTDTDTYTGWYGRLRLALVTRSVDNDTAGAVIDEVVQHCAETGESPEEAFGPADEYATTVARERVPPEARAGRRWDGLTRRDHTGVALMLTGWLTVLTGGVLWASRGTMIPLTTAGLTGTVLVGLALLTGCLAVTLSGYRNGVAGRWAVATVVLTALAVAAFTALPADSLPRMPAPVIPAPGVALLVWGLAHGSEAGAKDTDDRPLPAGADGTVPAEDWLRRLSQLLRDTHGLPAVRAAELTADAAEHLTATESTPEEEFGPVERYALHLADQEPTPRPRWWARDGVRSALLGLVVACSLAWLGGAADGPLWLKVVAAVVVLGSLYFLARELWARWSGTTRRD
ncbi:hypothetical protein [Streptomyces sp. SM12]|uniref:hypothetical protein n=1 Tax=Streptomyces sp. SM12 TaxID=1071602 RepID=UPI000CD51ABC|nr:hypothetical protein [Streptomyces sp. SM12]